MNVPDPCLSEHPSQHCNWVRLFLCPTNKNISGNMKKLYIAVLLCSLLLVYMYIQREDHKCSSLIPNGTQAQVPAHAASHPSTHAPTEKISTPTNYTLISMEEWRSLTMTLEWPSPDRAPASAKEATDPNKCSYEVINLRDNYTVGDFISISIIARDLMGQPKNYGGDFFQAKMHSPELKASSFGSVIDHRNGTYTAHFTLLWSGAAHISVRLVHSSEAVQVLRRQREQDPDKVFFRAYFKEGDKKETVVCNAMKSTWLVGDGKLCCCEYLDPVTKEAWFCRRPAFLPCSALISHIMGGYQAKLSKLDSSFLHIKNTNRIIPEGSPVLYILPGVTDIRVTQKCQPGLDAPVPAGFFYQDRWTSLLCSSQAFPTSELKLACLKDKQIHMMGDSTLRQWFEYLVETITTLKYLNLHTSAKSGPLMATDTQSNILLTWRAHGLPLRTTETPMADLHYIADEIGHLAGGEHTVFVFNIWAHFTTHPLTMYVRRLAIIRQAVVSLLRRSPHTLVVIKSANTGYKDVYGSDWLSWQLDCTLRAMFKGLPVVLLDVWQMTSCHYSPDNIHPPPIVVQNEVDLFLSFICPQ